MYQSGWAHLASPMRPRRRCRILGALHRSARTGSALADRHRIIPKISRSEAQPSGRLRVLPGVTDVIMIQGIRYTGANFTLNRGTADISAGSHHAQLEYVYAYLRQGLRYLPDNARAVIPYHTKADNVSRLRREGSGRIFNPTRSPSCEAGQSGNLLCVHYRY